MSTYSPTLVHIGLICAMLRIELTLVIVLSEIQLYRCIIYYTVYLFSTVLEMKGSSFLVVVGCVPWPCSLFLGVHIPAACQHYVHAPHDINVEFLPSDSPMYDIAIISWRPSLYGSEPHNCTEPMFYIQ